METGFPQSPLSYRPYKYPQDMIAWLIFFYIDANAEEKEREVYGDQPAKGIFCMLMMMLTAAIRRKIVGESSNWSDGR